MRVASMLQAQWIAKQMLPDFEKVDPDDVYDVLTGQITQPKDFVEEVAVWAEAYDEDFRRNNDRLNR